MPVAITTKTRSFSQLPGESILSSAAVSGFNFPHSCKVGRCNTCKCRVIEGHTKKVGSETGLTKDELEAGWILGCVREAVTDVTIGVEEVERQLFPTQTLPCKIQELSPVSPDVLKVVLRFPQTRRLSYHPGQYIDVIAPGGVRRSYSIANAPGPNNWVELHIKRLPDGELSDYWFNVAKLNDLLRVRGAFGTFFLERY